MLKGFWTMVTYRSGRTFSYVGGDEMPALQFSRRGTLLGPDIFEVATYKTMQSKPRSGDKGVKLEIDQRTMEEIISQYQKLFPEGEDRKSTAS